MPRSNARRTGTTPSTYVPVVHAIPRFGPGFASVTTDAQNPIGLLIPNDYHLLSAVSEDGPVTASEVSKSTGLIVAVVQLHLVELADRGLVLSRHIGGSAPRSVFVITELGSRALRERPARMVATG